MGRCPCGKPLHYSSKALETLMLELAERFGEFKPVTTPDGTWLVSVHYIALHGIKAETLPEVAEQLGFAQVRDASFKR